jgi:hypothetical protein
LAGQLKTARPWRRRLDSDTERAQRSLSNALGAQHVIERDWLARKSAGSQVLSDRTPHRCTLNGLPLHLGDFAPEAVLKLCGNCASPLGPTGAAINVLSRPKPRLSATLHSRSSRYLGVQFHPIRPLFFGPRLQCPFWPVFTA